MVGCFGFNGPLRQYFSLYRAVSQREGERGEKRTDDSKNVQTPPPAPTTSAVGPCPTVIQIVGRPSTGSLPSTIAPSGHPRIRVGQGPTALAVGVGRDSLDIFSLVYHFSSFSLSLGDGIVFQSISDCLPERGRKKLEKVSIGHGCPRQMPFRKRVYM